VRTGKLASFLVALLAAGLLLGATPMVARDGEGFPGRDPERPFAGYTRGDGTIVLEDESFCRFVLGAALGDRRLTFVDLLDKSKKQKKARGSAFAADADEVVLQRCVEALTAFRADLPPQDDDLPGWARRAAVVPASLAALLPDDFVAQPLAQPEEIGPAARTSGTGDLVSPPFAVAPGPWLAVLDAVGCAKWQGQLRDARDPARSFPLEGTREYLYELDAGHYYWDVSAPGCEWSVDLVPLDLGADPNATPVPRVPVPALAGSGWNAGRANASYLTATEARDALAEAGLTVGECVEEQLEVGNQGFIDPGRVWGQEPQAGTLLELGSPVDVFATSDCDVILGDRVILE
jgi:hypothetical protein